MGNLPLQNSQIPDSVSCLNNNAGLTHLTEKGIYKKNAKFKVIIGYLSFGDDVSHYYNKNVGKWFHHYKWAWNNNKMWGPGTDHLHYVLNHRYGPHVKFLFDKGFIFTERGSKLK